MLISIQFLPSLFKRQSFILFSVAFIFCLSFGQFTQTPSVEASIQYQGPLSLDKQLTESPRFTYLWESESQKQTTKAPKFQSIFNYGEVVTRTRVGTVSRLRSFTQPFVCAENTLVVTNINDSGPGSLRSAIISANSLPGCDRIVFSIPDLNPKVIQLATILPTITEGVDIDGTTQSEYNPLAPAPVVQIDGELATGFTDACGPSGLCFDSSFPNMNSRVLGLSIVGFTGAGIAYGSTKVTNNSAIIIQGNYIGVTLTNEQKGNGNSGVALGNSSGHTIGGNNPADRNIISGNGGDGVYLFSADNTAIENNYIGTDVTGLLDFGNEESGIYIDFSYFVSIGGPNDSQRNIISGNGQDIEDGITLIADNFEVDIQNNYIGTDASGLLPLGNAYSGIYIASENNTNIRLGSCTGGGNLVSANGIPNTVQQYGIFTFGDDSFFYGNTVGLTADLLNALDLQGKDMVVVGNNNIIGGTGGCGNTFKPGTANVESLGFGNKFRQNTGTNIPPNVDFNWAFSSGDRVEPQNVTLVSTPSDIDGRISKVEYIYQGSILGESASAPYNYLWGNLFGGEYTLYARAFDNNGLSSKSALKTVTVERPNVRWSAWNANGAGFGRVVEEIFNDRIYQIIRGTDNGIYTRSSEDGIVWSPWVFSGATIETPSMVVHNNRLFQAVRGTDNTIYTRSTSDGVLWGPWLSSGFTVSPVEMKSFGNILVQTVRGTDNGIYTRSRTGSDPWGPWIISGQTTGSIRLGSLGDTMFQTVRGTDNGIYTRSTTDGLTWTAWIWSGNTTHPVVMHNHQGRLYQGVRGTDGVLYVRSTNGSGWNTWRGVGLTSTTAEFASFGSQLFVTTRQSDLSHCVYNSLDGLTWSNCSNAGTALYNPSFFHFGERLYQGRIDSQNRLSTRSLPGNGPWEPWQQESLFADGPISYTVFKGGVVQTVRGLDSTIYTRKLS